METAFPQVTDAPEVSREKLAQDLRVLVHDAEALLKAVATEAGGKLEEWPVSVAVGIAPRQCWALGEPDSQCMTFVF